MAFENNVWPRFITLGIEEVETIEHELAEYELNTS